MIQELNRGLNDKNPKHSPNKSLNQSSSGKALHNQLSPPREHQDDEILLKNSPSKQKYIPSRYGVNEVMQSTNTLSKNALLTDLQAQMVAVDDEMSKMTPDKINNRLKEMKSYHPPNRTVKVSEFKSKPIKKSENDLLMFKEIFVAPKERVLNDLREKEKAFTDLVHHGAARQYDKIIGVEKDETKNIKSPESKLKRETIHFSTPKLIDNELLAQTAGAQGLAGLVKDKTKNAASVYKSHDKLQIPNIPADDDLGENVAAGPVNTGNKAISNERVFFEQQIQVQPPETPNYTTASPLTPGNGWAPSIPLIRMVDPSKSNVKDLLVRAKAGMQAGDVQKEAHLSFYLGMVHETKKEFRQAIRAYRKFLTCAQSMEDKIGVSLALNRLGVNYFNLGRADKSVDFHLKNLELSDQENCFAAYYNLGISYRSLKKYEEALQYFQTANDWAREFKDIESECLSTGQLGITYLDVGHWDNAMDNFKDCHDLSVKLNNMKLQLDCLLNMSKISNLLKEEEQENNDDAQTWSIYERAYDCAKGLGENQTANLCLCNMGVIEGAKKFDEFVKNFDFTNPN